MKYLGASLMVEMVWNLPAMSGLGRSPGEGNGNLLQHSRLENPMDRGTWQATVCGVANSQTQLSRAFLFCSHADKPPSSSRPYQSQNVLCWEGLGPPNHTLAPSPPPITLAFSSFTVSATECILVSYRASFHLLC